MAGFLQGGVWTEAIPRGGGAWDGNFHPNILNSSDIWMPGPEVKLPPKHKVCLDMGTNMSLKLVQFNYTTHYKIRLTVVIFITR